MIILFYDPCIIRNINRSATFRRRPPRSSHRSAAAAPAAAAAGAPGAMAPRPSPLVRCTFIVARKIFCLSRAPQAATYSADHARRLETITHIPGRSCVPI